MSAASEEPKSRVIVAVGSAFPDPSTLAAAAQLAHAVDGTLAALFVEDIDLLRLAELPFAFEIGATLPTPRPLATRDVERAFRAQADEIRRALAEIAHAHRLDLTFDIVRGRPARVLFEASVAHDIIVFASAAARTRSHSPLASVLRNALRATAPGARLWHGRTVAAVLQTGPAMRRVLAAAHRLARTNAAELRLFVAADSAQDTALADVVNTWLVEQGATARIALLQDRAPERVAALLTRAGAHALLWSGDGDPETAAQVEPLLAVINCPLIVVR